MRPKHILIFGVVAAVIGLAACIHGLVYTHDPKGIFFTLAAVNLAVGLGNAYYYNTQP